MKSAYELAMERLNKSNPSTKMTDETRQELAELDSKYAAKIAEREIFLKGEMAKAEEKGDFAELEELSRQLVNQRKALQTERDEKKEDVRKSKGSGAGPSR